MSGIGFGRRELIRKIIAENWNTDKPEAVRFTYDQLMYVIQELLVDEGKPYFERRLSTRGFRVFKEFVKLLLYRNIANYDSMVLVTSEKGTGKSSAALMIARFWCKLLGIKFNPKRHIAYNNADVINKIESLNPFEPIVCDEAVRFASAEDWNKRENKELKKKIAQVRTKHMLFILCFPLKVYKLEKNYLEAYVNYWCTVGETRILIKDKRGIRNLPIKKLVGHNYEVASYNIETKDIEFKKPEKRILTKKNAEIYEVEMENGVKIKVTKEHQFLTKNGYKQLQELTENDEILMRTKKCKQCGKEFVPKKEQMIWCSRKCNYNFHQSTPEAVLKRKVFWKQNKKEEKIKNRLCYQNNREKRLADAAIYREEKRQYINEYAKIYRRNNKDYWIKYMKIPNFKIAFTLRSRLRGALKSQKAQKNNSVINYIGCSIEFLKKYLEDRFIAGMSWENHGEWHIDHIRPCSSFDLTKEEECKKCFHFTNLQPMWAHDNKVKSDKYDVCKNKEN